MIFSSHFTRVKRSATSFNNQALVKHETKAKIGREEKPLIKVRTWRTVNLRNGRSQKILRLAYSRGLLISNIAWLKGVN